MEDFSNEKSQVLGMGDDHLSDDDCLYRVISTNNNRRQNYVRYLKEI